MRTSPKTLWLNQAAKKGQALVDSAFVIQMNDCTCFRRYPVVFILLVAFVAGCEQSSTEKSGKSNDADFSNLKSEDQYIAKFGDFLDEMISIVHPVSDSSTATEAIETLKTLEAKASELGEHAKQMRDIEDEAERDKIVRYLQDAGQEKNREKFEALQKKLGTSKAKSKFPNLWEASVKLINIAKAN